MGDVLKKFIDAPDSLISALDGASFLHRICCCASMETISAIAYDFTDYAFNVYSEVLRRVFGISGGWSRHSAFRELFSDLDIDYDYEEQEDVPKEDNPYRELFCFDTEEDDTDGFDDWASCVLAVDSKSNIDLAKLFHTVGEHEMLETEWPIAYHALTVDEEKRVTRARITIAKAPIEYGGGYYDTDPYDDDEVLNCLGAVVSWKYLREIAVQVNKERRCA